MKNKHLDFDKFLQESLKDPELKKEFDNLQPEYALIQAIIDARVHRGVTQAELAKRIGTKQSVISRIESGKGNPSIAFLKKIAQALNTQLEIRFHS